MKLLALPEGDHLGNGNDGHLVTLQNETRVSQVGVLMVSNETFRFTRYRLVNVVRYVVQLKGKDMK